MTASVETAAESTVVTPGWRDGRPPAADEHGTAAPTRAAVPVDGADHAPQRAEGVQLLGAVQGSGYRRAPALVRRADGQTIQLTPLLYQLLTEIDGSRAYTELAAALSESTGRLATADDVRFLVEAKLRPLGLLRRPDGSEPAVRKANPLLALRLKFVVSNPAVTNFLAAPFTAFFRLPVVLAVVATFATMTWWIAFEKGLASATHQAFYEPELLVLVFGLTLLSAAFHELGHAAACRFGGAKPGGMGMGLYLVWPAFYTDVTDAYRLGRGGRLRVDLGGLYFNAIFGIAIMGLWTAVRWDALLLVVVAQLIQMLRQLVPVVRFDGYHVLADLVGVPDLFLHIKPTLLGLLPTRWRGAGRGHLKPWARAVVTLWVLAVVPLLAALLFLVVVLLPRILATAWDSLGLKWGALETSWAQGDEYAVVVAVLSVLAVCLPVLGIAYLLVRVVRRTVRRVWRGTAGRPHLRAGAVLAGAVVSGALAWAWWPGDQYRPIEATEDLGLPSMSAPLLDDGGVERYVVSSPWSAQPAAALAAPSTPQGRWLLVLLPQSFTVARHATAAPAEAPDAGTGRDRGWVFPFDPPAPPGEGDNQALAVNTKDGSRVFDVALALVWVTDGGPVDNSNEAYALASCRRCETEAVAFQVVIVIGYAQVVTPLNAAVAINYLCAECSTQALALQLVTTLAAMPDAETTAELEAFWAELEQLSDDFELLPLDQVYADLVAAEATILEILEANPGAAATDVAVGGAGDAAALHETATSASTTTEEAPPSGEETSTTAEAGTTTAADETATSGETTTTTSSDETSAGTGGGETTTGETTTTADDTTTTTTTP
jgi:putative peptide zinc metalloprotease protein